jgi:hypothetical protein
MGARGHQTPQGYLSHSLRKVARNGVDFVTTDLGGCQPFPNEVSPMRLPHGTAINGRISENKNQNARKYMHGILGWHVSFSV